ncbi:MAG: uracil-DNA glycosylase [Actinobacteria bacterium]|nr:uracil-DNA glycosylase [Actinomycetota bacterium]
MDQLHASTQSKVISEEKDVWQKSQTPAKLNQTIKNCRKCKLAETRYKFVFGEGNPNADIVLIGEAPGADEDRTGKPFVGAAGRLLTKILSAIQLTREEVFICNVLKCRPPQNRNPQEDEIHACEPYLYKQIELIRPQFVLCLGLFAAQTLLKTTRSLGELRGQVHTFRNAKLLVTYHPAALLRFPQYKRPTWEDVQLLRRLYDEWKKS